MSSGCFSDINTIKKSLTPVLLDQVSFYIPIYMDHIQYGQPAPRRTVNLKGKPRERVEHPVASFFADAFIHYHGKGLPMLYPCGRRVALTGGKRIFQALMGDPLSGATSPKGVPHDTTIERHEWNQNQLTDEELATLVATPGCDPTKPYLFLFDTALAKIKELRSVIIKQKGLQAYNDLHIPFRKSQLKRIELYIEFPNVTDDDMKLHQSFAKAIGIAFGKARLNRFKVEDATSDYDGQPCILKWPIKLAMISNGKISGKGYIKLYRKGTRVRLEIQANSPSYHGVKNNSVGIDFQNFLSIENSWRSMANVIATALETISEQAVNELSKLSTPSLAEMLKQKINQCCHLLVPRVAEKKQCDEFINLVVKQGYVTRKQFRELGLNEQNLKILANPEFGFLKKTGKGLNGEQQNSQRLINPNFVLIEERLEVILDMERPNKQRKVKVAFNLPPKDTVSRTHWHDLIYNATGSARNTSDSSVLLNLHFLEERNKAKIA